MAIVTSYGVPFSRFVGTGAGGPLSRIIDGTKPANGTAASAANQWDDYHGGGAETDTWVGLMFVGDVSFTSILFQEGGAFGDGGYFTAEPTIEVRVAGVWTAVSAQSCSPTYAANGTTSFEQYTFSFTAITGDGIRVRGDPGGSSSFISCGEIEVNGTLVVTDHTADGTAIQAFSPTGGGGPIAVIKDGVKPAPGSATSSTSYDSYHGGGSETSDYVGLTFPSDRALTGAVFLSGIDYVSGGFFASTPTIQVRVSGVWTNVSSQTIETYGFKGGGPTTSYRPGDTNSESFRRYLFKFSSITGDGIRIQGTPGGSQFFISCGEFEAFGPASSGVTSTVAANVADDFAAAASASEAIPSTAAASIADDFSAAASVVAANPVTADVAATITSDFSASATASEAIPATVAASIADDFSVSASVAETIEGSVAASFADDFAAAASATVANPIGASVDAAITDDFAASASAIESITATAAPSITGDFAAAAIGVVTNPVTSAAAAEVTDDFAPALACVETVPSTVAGAISDDFAAAAAVLSAEPITATAAADLTGDIAPVALLTHSLDGDTTVNASITADFEAACVATETLPATATADVTADFVPSATVAQTVTTIGAASFTADIVPALTLDHALSGTEATVAAIITDDFAAAGMVAEAHACAVAAVLTNDMAPAYSVAVANPITSDAAADLSADFLAAIGLRIGALFNSPNSRNPRVARVPRR